MSDNSYEEYKKNLSRSNKRSRDLHRGKGLLIIGICFLLYLLFILPFNAGNVNRIRGDEIKAGSIYDRVRVYYIDQLHVLCAKTDTDNDRIYCIARFADRDQNEWVLLFTPGTNERLADLIRLSDSIESEFDLTVNGYFRLEPLDDLPFAADSFFSIYADKYGNADGSNLLSLNADYLCERGENYTQAALLRRGVPLLSLVVGLIGVLGGVFLLIRNQKHKTA